MDQLPRSVLPRSKASPAVAVTSELTERGGPARRQPSAPRRVMPGRGGPTPDDARLRVERFAIGLKPYNDVVPTAFEAAIQPRSAGHDCGVAPLGSGRRCRSPRARHPAGRPGSTRARVASEVSGEAERGHRCCTRSGPGRPRCRSLTAADPSARRRVWLPGRSRGPGTRKARIHAHAHRREVEEQLGIPLPAGALSELGPPCSPAAKLVYGLGAEGDLASAGVRTNRFTLEWPPRSGLVGESPEFDRAHWFASPNTAQDHPAQVAFLERPRETLEGNGPPRHMRTRRPECRRPAGRRCRGGPTGSRFGGFGHTEQLGPGSERIRETGSAATPRAAPRIPAPSSAAET
jgi:hypothetical protein